PLFILSSPYARRGELWELYHYGALGDPAILVAQGSSRDFNDTLRQSLIDRALERDAASASARYLAPFRTAIERFISLETVNANIAKGVCERPYHSSLAYQAFADPSGGSSDSFTLAIGHQDYARQTTVIDAIRETRPPFSPEQVCEDYARLLNQYSITQIQ